MSNKPAKPKAPTNKQTPDKGQTPPDTQNEKAATQPHGSEEHHPKSWRRSWNSASPLTKLALVIAGLSAVATTAYAVYSHSQLNVMRGQLKQMELSTRPWLGLSREHPVRADPITIDANSNIQASCAVSVENYGDYPAQNVMPFCGLMVLQGNITRVHERIRELCHEGTPAFEGAVLFQGRSNTWSWAVSVPEQQIIRGQNGGPFFVFLIGSVHYRDQGAVSHCTAFGFKRNFQGTINTVFFNLTPNTTIPGEWVEWDGVVDP